MHRCGAAIRPGASWSHPCGPRSRRPRRAGRSGPAGPPRTASGRTTASDARPQIAARAGGGSRQRGFVVAGAAVAVASIVGLFLVFNPDPEPPQAGSATTEPTESSGPVDTASEGSGPDGSAAVPGRVLRSGGQELAFGEAHEGELVSADDVGRYEFEGVVGEPVRILVRSLDAKLLDPKVALIGPNGDVVVEEDDISDSNRNNDVEVALDEEGVHVVEVRAVQRRGAVRGHRRGRGPGR